MFRWIRKELAWNAYLRAAEQLQAYRDLPAGEGWNCQAQLALEKQAQLRLEAFSKAMHTFIKV